MENGATRIASKIRELTDIELAILLCLIADEHCIIEADRDQLDNVENELKLICKRIFGLSCAVVHFSEATSLEDFGRGILIKADEDDVASHSNQSEKDGLYFGSPPSSRPSVVDQERSNERDVAQVIVARDLNKAHQQVQVLALELIRSKRVFSRTSVHVAPKRFLFLPLLASGGPKLTLHLNDQILISHSHFMADPLPNLEDEEYGRFQSPETSSLSSVVRSPPETPAERPRRRKSDSNQPFISDDDIDGLIATSKTVVLSTDVRAYIHDIVVYLRFHRAVAGGVSALATRHLHLLLRAIAPLHSLTSIPPSLVDIGVRKIYPHRLVLVTPHREWSLQWGSTTEAVAELLRGVTVEDIIEEVLENVETPL